MGLDQYLYARKEVSEYADKPLSTKLNQIAESLLFPGEVTGITVEAMYWRKANAIHRWFVENVQSGEDDCLEANVEVEDLLRLKTTIDRCLADTTLAPELLPTQAGCFFGSLEYDEWYWKELEKTSERLGDLIEMVKDDFSWSFTYRSSW